MTAINGAGHRRLTAALEAVGTLWEKSFAELKSSAVMAALSAHNETTHGPLSRDNTVSFYRYFLPFRDRTVALLTNSYRLYLKLALANTRQTGRDPDKWSWSQLQPAVCAALEWIREWYILACDEENQYVRREPSTEFVTGRTVSLAIPTTVALFPPPDAWRAPRWLFQVSLVLFGVGVMKPKNMPDANPEQRLGEAHTRLLLKGARRVFLWNLKEKIKIVRMEEIVAAGAIRAGTANGRTRGPNKRQGSEQRSKLYSAIQKTLHHDSSLEGMEFCAELDKRHAPPLYDWTKSGEWRKGLTWKEAWRNPALRRKIRRVRQEAMKAC